ncbi:MAG: hypothetical protein NFW04_08075 [Candidatus Accumulibacter sp.]|uniref:hypothetical protein n=1 Tax=Accumulibacter sp. TaxID=2053492 RepID=UPI0025E48818|nr:hypothetical protein [Accumulibacter sp.]MCM8598598.1 hypothetical protein [Accumulibacter sp.]
MMSVNAYLSRLQLAPVAVHDKAPAPAERLLRSGAGSADTAPAPAATPIAEVRAAVNVGSLVSFVDGLDAQSKDDVLDSLQLAQRAASGAHDRFAEVQAWYEKYLEVLNQVGWVTEQFAFVAGQQSEGELRMDQAALAVIMAIATQNQLAILKEAVSALESLASTDHTISLFSQMSAREGAGNFQMGAAQQAANGAVSLAMGAFHFQSQDQTSKILFFKRATKALQVWSAAQRMTFDPGSYAGVRDQIREMLGEQRRQAIAALKLG